MSKNWCPVKWTADEDATLMRMRERHFSFGEIARTLGRTRNSVAGRVDRLGRPAAKKAELVTEQPT